MIDTEELRQWAASYGIVLEEKMLAQLGEYAEMLVAWNQKINLTAITQPREIAEKHFLDSLLLASQAEVCGQLADVGSGAGFPGLVAAIFKPDLAVSLFEPTGKRVTFLQEVAKQLQLANVTVLKERAEEAARKGWREKYTVVTARAVAALPILCEYCLPLAAKGGCFIAMKGEAGEELAQAQNAISQLGGQWRRTVELQLPQGAARSLIFIEKQAPTPAKYPRNGGTIAKRPL